MRGFLLVVRLNFRRWGLGKFKFSVVVCCFEELLKRLPTICDLFSSLCRNCPPGLHCLNWGGLIFAWKDKNKSRSPTKVSVSYARVAELSYLRGGKMNWGTANYPIHCVQAKIRGTAQVVTVQYTYSRMYSSLETQAAQILPLFT